MIELLKPEEKKVPGIFINYLKMKKSKTILDFFKSPSNKNAVSPSTNGSSSSDRSEKREKVVEKTPKTSKATPKCSKRKLSIDNGKSEKNSARKLEESDDEKIADSKQIKRRRIVIASDSDDSADDYKPGSDDALSESEDDLESDNISESEDDLESDNISESETPEKKGKPGKKLCKNKPSFDAYKNDKSPSSAQPSCRKSLLSQYSSSPKQAQTPDSSFNSSFNSSPKTFSRKSSETVNQTGGLMDNKAKYLHERLDWLMPNTIKDKNGRKKSHPDYDPRTLYVPESFKKTLTPGMKQWWDIKSENFDTVLFFKVGKFYEFYHMDAAIGVKELDLSYMKGDFAHAGFPEIAFGKFSEILIQKGYKVARIEQTETPQMMEQRCKKMSHPTKYDKVVKREVCQVTSKGTRTLSYEEWSNNLGANSNYLLALCEKHANQDVSTFEYGICFVDTTIGKFTLGQFTDDRHQSRLLSFIGMYPPVEILFDKTSISSKTSKLFDSNLSSASKQLLGSNSFWDADKTLKFLIDSKYYTKEGDIELPSAILEMIDKDDKLYQTPLKCYELAFKSLGACIWYLKKCYIEDCLLTMKMFEVYKPSDETSTNNKQAKIDSKHMILDNVTLHNLAIVSSQHNLKSEETLFGTLNYCETNFGKRELRKWLCSPLCKPDEINDRLLAIDDLRDISIFDDVRKVLRKLPDLERLLSKIHVNGLVRSKDHPETRAVFYSIDIYNKRKIMDLHSAIEGFKDASHISVMFEKYVSEFKSKILKECISTKEDCNFPSMEEILSYFSEAFDTDEAIKKGSIIPRPGIDKKYDSACEDIKEFIEKLNSYKKKQSKMLNCDIKFVNVGKNRYLLEVPESKKIPSDYEFLGGRKGFKRFHTKDLKELIANLAIAEEARDSALRDCTRNIFEQFDQHYMVWQKAVQCLSTLDVLLSLTYYCKTSDGKMCKPIFLSEDESKPYLEIVDGRHPTFVKYFTDKDYIPNSISIGNKNENMNTKKVGNLILVTGPNMGGKSTLMRQTGTLLVMAHLGCYVPAESMILTPVDRIFTRVGANDQIYKGESTFFVEASETASILHHATCHSFVLIDELGRGTATYDGTAIAYATADFLANDIGCRTLFSTHYHSLVEDFRSNPNIGLGHMACLVEENNDCPTLEKVTFLYKFVDGACPKSYGFNVSLLAGIKKEIVNKGFQKSQQVDYVTKISKCFRQLLRKTTPDKLLESLAHSLN